MLQEWLSDHEEKADNTIFLCPNKKLNCANVEIPTCIDEHLPDHPSNSKSRKAQSRA